MTEQEMENAMGEFGVLLAQHVNVFILKIRKQFDENPEDFKGASGEDLLAWFSDDFYW